MDQSPKEPGKASASGAEAPASAPVAAPRRRRWLRWVLLSLLVLVVAVVAFARFALPSIVRTQAEKIAQETLHRRLAIDQLEIHPLSLSFSVQGLHLYEPDGSTVFAGFDLLEARLSASTFTQFAPVLAEVRLVGPAVHAVRTAPNHYSFDDILATLAAAPPKPAAPPGPAPRVAVYNIRIEKGHFEFDDTPLHAHHAVTDFSLGVPFVSTFTSGESVYVEPSLQAVIDGAPLAIKGRALPFAATQDFLVNLDFSNIDVPRYLGYVPGKLPVAVPGARLDLHLQAKATMAKDQAPVFGLTGTVGVKGLEVTSAEGKPMIKLASLGVDLRRVDWPSGALDVGLLVNGTGKLDLSGKVGIAPTAADLDFTLQNLDLLPTQPLFADKVNLRVTHAGLSAKGHVHLDQAEGKPLAGSFAGDIGLDKLATVDALNANEFLSWDGLALRGLKVQLSPLSVQVDSVALNNYYARIIIDPSGRINLQDIARQGKAEVSLTEVNAAGSRAASGEAGDGAARPGGAAASAEAAPAQPAHAGQAGPADGAKGPPIPISVGAIDLKSGHVRFTDNFIKPRYTADLVDLTGKISKLSSDATTHAQVDIHGQVNGAPLLIGGTVNPLARELSLDIKASVHDMELAPLTSYSAKYVGYRIERGKMSFDVAYQLENRKLKAENRLVLDQLTFGDKVESPTATTLPVQLAIALLKDRNGVIDINLPIGGSLDDPDFSVGGIIIKVIVNLITKAITAPFALLGNLFGGSSQEISWVDFPAGLSTLEPSSEDKLRTLAKALTERPGLKLDITGWADPASDDAGLRRAIVLSKLRGLQRLERSNRAADTPPAEGEGNTNLATTDNVIDPKDYPALLAKLYARDVSGPAKAAAAQASAAGGAKPAADKPVADKAAADKAASDKPAGARAPAASAAAGATGDKSAAPPGPPTTEEMEQALADQQHVTEEDLRSLGNARAATAKAWLKTIGNIPEDRLALVGAKLAKATEEGAKPGGEGAEAADAKPVEGKTADKAAPGHRVEFGLH